MAQRRIYLLTGLPEEVTAVAFAKCSRSPEPFDKIARELNRDQSRRFHEKWVVGYGHSSVAEHAVVHLALENISILATKAVEDTRLASFTEKSTRYQKFDLNRCYRDERLMQQHGPMVESTLDQLFSTYALVHKHVSELMKQNNPRMADEKESAYATRINALTCDVARYILPVGTLTNVGVTINARSLEHCITKLFSHSLQEMREIGAEIKSVAQQELPTLLKYAQENNFLKETEFLLDDYFSQLHSLYPSSQLPFPHYQKFSSNLVENQVTLEEFDSQGLDKLLTALLYPHSYLSRKHVFEIVASSDKGRKIGILNDLMEKRGPKDSVPRAFEAIDYVFDILVDYGAYRDIQRHRMLTPLPQLLTVWHGYNTPPEIALAGLEKEYAKVMEETAKAVGMISRDFPEESQYLIPLAYRIRVLQKMNLREVFQFTELRSGKNGHPSYRKIAQQMADEVIKVHPQFGRYLRIDRSE